MKIVLDTNVVVSGLLTSGGNPAQVLTLALSGAVQTCHDHRIIAEYRDVLHRPRFKFEPIRIREILAKFEIDGLSIDPRAHAGLDLPDPDDECFLAVALAGSADFLVTGNLSDYPPDKRQSANVVSPATFMQHWRRILND